MSNTDKHQCVKLWSSSIEISEFPRESLGIAVWCQSYPIGVLIGGRKGGSDYYLVLEASDVFLTCL